MRRFLQKLRKKPKSTRRKIAFGTSASITGVIFAVWLTVMLAGGGVGVKAGGTNQGQNQAASPLGALGANAGSALTEVRERLSSSNTSTNSATTSVKDTLESRDQQSAQPSNQQVDGQSYWESGAAKKKSTQVEEKASSQHESESEEETTDSQPYWEANDSEKDDSAKSTQPPSQVGKDFWQDPDEDKEGNGWF